MAEVLGNEARVAGLLTEPRRRGMSQRVGVTCSSIPARVAARRMMSARIVSCRRRPARPQKTGSVASGCRVSRTFRSSRARPAGTGWRRGFPPLPQPTSNEHFRRRGRDPATQGRRARSGEGRSSRARATRVGRARRGPADSAEDWLRRRAACRHSSGVNQSRSWRGFGGGSRSRNGSGRPSRLVAQRRKRRRRRNRR